MLEETLSLASIPRHALTVAEYLALPEDTERRYELVEGGLAVTPRALPTHSSGQVELAVALRAAAPPASKVLLEVDVDLQLVPSDGPATVRVPDIAVVTRASYDRVTSHGGLLTARDVILAVEILSPSTRRTDRMVKYAEYADAGIPHYWVVDLDEGPSLLACRLVDGEYVQATHHGVAALVEPFAVTVDLGALV